MIFIYDLEDDRYAVGETLHEAQIDWKDCYGGLPDIEKVKIIEGNEMKAEIVLKPVAKTAVKQTKQKAK